MKKISRGNAVSKFRFRYGTFMGVLFGFFAAQAAFSATIADSVADFTGTQGSNSWSYGWGSPASETVPVLGAFVTLPYYAGGVWRPGNTTNSPLLTAAGGHPGYENGVAGRWAVRKYVVPVSGLVRLSGMSRHTYDHCRLVS